MSLTNCQQHCRKIHQCTVYLAPWQGAESHGAQLSAFANGVGFWRMSCHVLPTCIRACSSWYTRLDQLCFWSYSPWSCLMLECSVEYLLVLLMIDVVFSMCISFGGQTALLAGKVLVLQWTWLCFLRTRSKYNHEVPNKTTKNDLLEIATLSAPLTDRPSRWHPEFCTASMYPSARLFFLRFLHRLLLQASLCRVK